MKNTLIIIIIIFIIALFKLFPNYSKVKVLEEDNQSYILEIVAMKKEIEDLRNDISNFKTDPFYVEKIARNELGIAKENEVIVQVE